MTPEQFCYWLQGRLELSDAPLTPDETLVIRDHLNTVFRKVTPVRPPSSTEQHQSLDELLKRSREQRVMDPFIRTEIIC